MNKTFIVSRTDKIGDLLLSIPSFFRLRKMFPEAKIIVLVRQYNFEIVENLPYIDKVVKIDDYSEKELINLVKSFKADYFISLFTNKFIGKLARKSGANYRIGPYSKFHSLYSYNKGIIQHRANSIKNETEYNLDLIRKVDENLFNQNKTINTEICLQTTHLEFATNYLLGIKEKIIAVNPFSAGSAKNLKLSQYKKLIELILENTENFVIILGHISNKKEIFENFENIESKRLKIFINENSILFTASLINKCDLYLGGSTGHTHIAGAFGKKIIAFYSGIKSQSIIRWGVFNNSNVSYFGNNFACPGKMKCNKKCENYDCFDKIDLDEVVKAVIEKLVE